jgi:diguanylate cyclase (GGDEF)-like protein
VHIGQAELEALRSELDELEAERAAAIARAARLGGLARALAAIAGSREPDDVVFALLQAFRETLQCERTIYFEASGNSLSVRNGVDAGTRARPVQYAPIPLAAFPALFPATSVAIGEPHDLCAPLLDTRGWYVFASLADEGRVVGAVYADGFTMRRSNEALDPLRMITTVAAAALRGSYLYKQICDLAIRDHLTGLLNRRALENRLRDTIEAARRRGYECTLVILDVDDFKLINDVFGHVEGDLVLSKVAATLAHVSREGDVVGRLAGDEFVAFFVDTESNARHLVRRLSSELRSNGLRCSLGAAVFPHAAADAEALFRAADRALYAVKAAGKNGFAFAEV